jgi:hypothetical protein
MKTLQSKARGIEYTALYQKGQKYLGINLEKGGELVKPIAVDTLRKSVRLCDAVLLKLDWTQTDVTKPRRNEKKILKEVRTILNQ